MTESHFNAGDISNGDSGWSTTDKIGLEVEQVWHGLGSGVIHGLHDRIIEHPVKTVLSAAGSAAVGFGLSTLAYRYPRTATAVGVVLKSGLAADIAVRAIQTIGAGIDTWNNPGHYARNEKSVEQELGYGLVDYSILGLAGAAGFGRGEQQINASRTLAGGVKGAFAEGGGEIPKLEMKGWLERPTAKFQVLDDSMAARTYMAQKAAVVRIDIDFMDSSSSRGTGFIVDGKKGWIATNWHVGNTGGFNAIVTPDSTVSSLEFLAGDKQADLAIFKTSTKPFSRWPQVELGNSDGLERGDTLYGIGHPAGAPQDVLTTGKFVKLLSKQLIVPTDKPPIIAQVWARMPQLGGSSGTPIFDEGGKLVAVLTSGTGNTRVGATAVEHLQALLGALRSGENTIPRYGWMDVETSVADAPNGRFKAPLTVQASWQVRRPNAPIVLLDQYDHEPPGIDYIYGGLLQRALGIVASFNYIKRLTPHISIPSL